MVEFTENDHHGEEEVSEEDRRDAGEPVDESAAEAAAAQEALATAEETADEEGEHEGGAGEEDPGGAQDAAPAEDAAAAAEDAAEQVSGEAADAGEGDGSEGGGEKASEADPEDGGHEPDGEAAADGDADQAEEAPVSADEATEPAEAEDGADDGDADDDADDDEVEEMTIEQYDLVQVRPGDVIEGQIVQVDDEHILVDVGYKAEGLVPLSEMTLKPGESPGDVFEVDEKVYVRVLSIDHRDGALLLSERRARAERVWDELEKALEDETIIEAPVVEEVKGGLVADVGVRAFMPASHVERGYVGDLSQYEGQTLRARVIEIDRSKNRVILSRRTVLEIEHEARRAETWASLEEGQVRSGVVKGITDFGAFIDLGGVDGLLHVSEMAWGRVDHPSDVVEEGQDIDVKVLRVDRERERISLGLKQILPDPWEEAHLKYAEDSIIEGKVMRLAPFGAFVQLEPGVEGLVHISQLAHHHVHNPDEVVSEGETVMVKVLRVQPDERRISLSIKEALPPEEVIEYRRPARRDTGEDEGEGDSRAPRERGRGRGRRPSPSTMRRVEPDYDTPADDSGGNGGVTLGTLGDLFGDALTATRQALQAEEDARAEEAETDGDDSGAEDAGEPAETEAAADTDSGGTGEDDGTEAEGADAGDANAEDAEAEDAEADSGADDSAAEDDEGGDGGGESDAGGEAGGSEADSDEADGDADGEDEEAEEEEQ